MKKYKLSDMQGGWFVGDFSPTCYPTARFEVALKRYGKGDSEARHVHKKATELTLIAEGSVKMNGNLYKQGDIIVIEPGESTDFEALEDSWTVVVKTASVKGDKYPA